MKALVSHIMETGQRKSADGKVIPRKILNKFTCTVNGKEVFAADFEPAVSANPYIQFKFKATESGPVVLTWIDDDGSNIVGEDSITVSSDASSLSGSGLSAARACRTCAESFGAAEPEERDDLTARFHPARGRDRGDPARRLDRAPSRSSG